MFVGRRPFAGSKCVSPDGPASSVHNELAGGHFRAQFRPQRSGVVGQPRESGSIQSRFRRRVHKRERRQGAGACDRCRLGREAAPAELCSEAFGPHRLSIGPFSSHAHFTLIPGPARAARSSKHSTGQLLRTCAARAPLSSNVNIQCDCVSTVSSYRGCASPCRRISKRSNYFQRGELDADQVFPRTRPDFRADDTTKLAV